VSAELAAGMSNSMSQTVNQLYRRTQTVQLYRDAVFALCQGAMNGSIKVSDTTRVTMEESKHKEVTDAGEEIAPSEIKTLLQNFPIQYTLSNVKAIETAAPSLTEREKEKVETIATSLNEKLRDADYEERLRDSLKGAYVSLKEELPYFYETEKMRFLAELGKPVIVCNTEVTETLDEKKKPDASEGAEEVPEEVGKDKPKQRIKKVSCEAQYPENIDELISAYANFWNNGQERKDDEGEQNKANKKK